MLKIVRRSIAILLCVTATILLLIPAGNVDATFTKGDYEMDGGTLVKYTGTESDITIPLGVTKIGHDAFSGNNYLKKVYIPDGIDIIDFSAFENCKNLEKVSMGNDVKIIGQSVFSGCQSLSDVNLPRYVEEIGSGAFAACPSLSIVKIDPQNRNFICLDGVIYTRDGNKMVQYLAGRPYSTYDIPEPVTEIGEFGFYGANMLTSVGIVKGVTEIPEYTFLNCNGLSNVTIPSTVEAIRKGSFGGCPNLTALAVPTTVRYIDPDAFTSLTGEKGDMVDSNTGTVLSEANSFDNTSDSAEHSSLGVSGTLQKLAKEAKNENNPEEADDNEESGENLADRIAEAVSSGRVNGELGSTKIHQGQAIFTMDPKSFTVHGFDINSAQTEDSIADSGNQTIDGNTVRSFSGNEFDIIGSTLGHYGGNNSNITIPNGVTKVGNRLFYKNRSISEVDLPSGVQEIGDFAFARSSVNKVNIPDGTNKIGYAAFYNCKDLNDIIIPSSVTDIELGAFDGSGFLQSWKDVEDGKDFLIAGDDILIAYKGFGGDIIIPNGIKKIGPGVFKGQTRLKSVTFPESVTEIGEDAFNGCTDLKSVTLPTYLETIEDRAFKDTRIDNVIIPASVKEIGLGAFDTSNVNGGMEYVNFSGNTLPDITYKPTASRLSANDIRTCAFEGTKYALINGSSDINSGDLFDPYNYGFRGEVISSTAESEDGHNQYELRKVTRQPDKNGNVEIDSDITLGGTAYLMNGVRESAFSAYENTDWCNNDVNAITLSGKKSTDLENMINALQIGRRNSSGEPIDISIDPTLGFNSPVRAVIPDNNEQFKLNVALDDSSQSDFMQAFNNRYGKSDNVIMTDLSIDMTDRLGAIPIHKMASGKMEIEMPLPENMKNAENVYVATLDDNGLLENITSEVITDEEGNKDGIKFVASHLSPYAIYYFTDDSSMLITDEDMRSEEIVVDNDETLGLPFGKQLVVKSLDKRVGTIPARYIVVFILFLTAILLFIIPSRKLNKK